MSAEKQIVNYWLNAQDFFTINNIKVKNKDIGIIALGFKKEKLREVWHVEVSCSISGNITETAELKNTINKLVDSKFFDQAIKKKIDNYVAQFPSVKIKKVLVLGLLPKSRKDEIINIFRTKGIRIVGFDEIIYSVIQNIDTQYYKDSVIRTLQLIKYLLLSNPKKLAELIEKGNILNTSTRGKFFNELLSMELIKKEFTKTGEEQITSILRNITLRPEKLAELLEKDILNRRTRKPFLTSLLEQEKMRKLYQKETKKAKIEKPLSHFFR